MAQAQPLPREILAAIRLSAIATASAVMRVEVTGNVGYLFFLQGELVHGSTLELEGEPAVSAILSWREGELAWCERRWPRERTVFRTWSELADAPPVAAPPADARPEAPPTPVEVEESAPALHFPSSFGLRQTFNRTEFKNALRIGIGGSVDDNRGSTAHLKPILLASLTLGDSLGAAFGLGPLLAAEASASGFFRLVARSSEDGVAVETGGGSALQLARAFLKL